MARAKVPVVADEPVAETKVKVDLPGIADVLVYHGLDGRDYPLIVTLVGDNNFAGQALLDGTQRAYLEGLSLGDDLGMASRK